MQFECTRCGRCCKWRGTAKIFPADLNEVLLGSPLSREAFVAENCLIVDETHDFTDGPLKYRMLSLRAARGSCVLLRNDQCSVHAHKPLICRLAPFSYSHWNDSRNRHIFLDQSPGFRQGRVWSDAEIGASIQEEVSAWQTYFAAIEIVQGRWWELYTLKQQPEAPVAVFHSRYARPWR
jgi:hypothetical protein